MRGEELYDGMEDEYYDDDYGVDGGDYSYTPSDSRGGSKYESRGGSSGRGASTIKAPSGSA